MNRVLFKSEYIHWRTPEDLYEALNREFNFTLDPCPNGAEDGLTRSWSGERVYCNPPYGRGVGNWLAKAQEADLAVFLLPSRTDTRWWHDYAGKAKQIRFIKGRLKFKGATNPAPFPSVILVYEDRCHNHDLKVNFKDFFKETNNVGFDIQCMRCSRICETRIAMANLATDDDIRKKAIKLFRRFHICEVKK